ncbi:MAG: sensor histidine kinase [Gammaproteobacteria bacterium]|nr:sensor histidine kinase [Gammaproteobacteria bacterium]
MRKSFPQNLYYGSFFITGLFCLLIALVLPLFGSVQTFSENLVVSLCIGYSINIFTIMGHALVKQYVHSLLIGIFGFAAGTPTGLAMGGWILKTSPGYLFANGSTVLFISLFFGALGAALINALWCLIDIRRQLRDSELKQLQQEKLLLESELKSLQAQIEPHFLFNTLANTIDLVTTAPNQAVSMLENLTSLLRVSLKRTRDGQTTLGEELNILESYLAIQKIRLGDRLGYTIECDAALHSQELAPLLLQPLVENAVMHGIEPSTEGGVIQINICRRDNVQNSEELEISISNTGSPFLGSQSGKRGYGLDNVEQRLLALYGSRARLQIRQKMEQQYQNQKGTIVSMSIPIMENQVG